MEYKVGNRVFLLGMFEGIVLNVDPDSQTPYRVSYFNISTQTNHCDWVAEYELAKEKL